MEKTFRLTTISEFHELCGLSQPEHPMISLIDYSLVKYPFHENHIGWIQEFYSIGLKRDVGAKFNYGQQQYDFNKGILSFIAPLQYLKIQINQSDTTVPNGWLLLVHPDFLWQSNLAKKIKTFEFFGYSVNEALFLSDKEEKAIEEILIAIQSEYNSNIDSFSHELMINQLERLLIYSERYYQRQFRTRKKSNYELLERFEAILKRYFNSQTGLVEGVPTVTSIAEQLCISPNYLGTLLRIHTRQNAQQHIHNNMINYAKMRLSTSDIPISELAYELGFEHSQSFSKLFKRKANQSPLEFKNSFN